MSCSSKFFQPQTQKHHQNKLLLSEQDPFIDSNQSNLSMCNFSKQYIDQTMGSSLQDTSREQIDKLNPTIHSPSSSLPLLSIHGDSADKDTGNMHRTFSTDLVKSLLDSLSTEELQLDSKNSVNTIKSFFSASESTLDRKSSMEMLLSMLDMPEVSKKRSMEVVKEYLADTSSIDLPRVSSTEILKGVLSSHDSRTNTMSKKLSVQYLQNYLTKPQQKVMTSADSFRFQSLATCLDEIERYVSGPSFHHDTLDDIGCEEVVAVDNLDNLLDYHSPPPSLPMYISPQQQQEQMMMYGYHNISSHTHQPQQYDMNILNQMHMIDGMNCGITGAMHGIHQPAMAPTMHNIQPSYNHLMQIGTGIISSNTNNLSSMMESSSSVETECSSAKFCSIKGCNNVARTKGFCKSHGGGRRCKIEGCTKSAQTGHLCIAHGGGKPCEVEGCPKTSQSRGLCKQHGGGVRCKYPGCTKSCQSGGFCRGHGGGKRCEVVACLKWAQKNGLCAKHSQDT